MGYRLTVFLLGIIFFSLTQIAAAESSAYQVTFATMSCSGESGFATVEVDRIFKMQSAGCAGEDGKQLKHVLVKNGSGSYDIYTVTAEESENITKEIKAYMAARRGLLERSQGIIIKP